MEPYTTLVSFRQKAELCKKKKMWFHNYADLYGRGLKLHSNKTDIRPEIHGDMVGFQL